MKINVMLAFSNNLFSEGIKRILDGEEDIVISEVIEPGSTCDPARIKGSGCNLVLVDFPVLYNSFPGLESMDDGRPFIILFDTNCGRENIVSAVLRKKINGVIPGDADRNLMSKAIRAVAAGEVWIDKGTVRDVLNGINAIGNDRISVLTEREKEVVALTGKGYRNKEIAQKLNIGEPTVKTHLHRIFQKLNIKNRSELITFAIKNQEIASTLPKHSTH